MQLANSLHDSFSVLKDLIERNAMQIDQIEPVQVGRAKNYFSKCNSFLEEISWRQQMFTPNSGVLFASSQRNKIIVFGCANVFCNIFRKSYHNLI